MRVDHRQEWEAFVDEALVIEESAENKCRRLAQLRRDISASAALDEVNCSSLVERLDSAIDFVTHYAGEITRG